MSELEELKARRDGMVQAKIDIQTEMVNLNAKLATTRPRQEFYELSARRKYLVQDIQRMETVLRELNNEIRKNQPQTHLGPDAAKEARTKRWLEIIALIREVRDKYQDIAAGEYDAHGPSERLLAAQVVRDLNPLMKSLIHE